VGVDDDAVGVVVDLAQDDVGGLAAGPWDFDEGLHVVGDLAAVALEQGLGGALEALGLVAVEAGAVDGFFDFDDGGFGEVLLGGELREEAGGDLVDAGVGALGAEDGGY